MFFQKKENLCIKLCFILTSKTHLHNTVPSASVTQHNKADCVA